MSEGPGIEWKPKPQGEGEVSSYLDWLFKFSGNNLWSKLVRDFLVKEFVKGKSTEEIPKTTTKKDKRG
jgi:hypothetical protein